MGVQPYTVLCWFLCIGLSGAYLLGRQNGMWPVGAMAKTLASTAFVAVAVMNGAFLTVYGQLILAALILSWFGDLLLLSSRHTYLLAGIAAFFLAHIAFAAAFTRLMVDTVSFTTALVVTSAVGAAILLWLWKYLAGLYRAAVPAYIAAIAVMSSLAIAANDAPALPVAAGAVLFAISDVAVAEERFVEPHHGRAWGLPLYYVAQLVLASSVIAVR